MLKSEKDLLETVIEQELKPNVRKIDLDAVYAEHYLQKLGELGFYASSDLPQKDSIIGELKLVKKTAETCMTTAFCLWCHFAALTYVRNTENRALKSQFLPILERGERLGGTGLSNALKYYAGLENLHLKAERTNGGYWVTGVLPAVSNLANDHLFAFVAEVNETERMMGFVSCDTEGLTRKAKTDYFGLNGSATYVCTFQNVFIPDDQVIAEDAGAFIEKIRPIFVAYQIPLGLGVIEASIQSSEKVVNRQNQCNQFLRTQPNELQRATELLEAQLHAAVQINNPDWEEITKIRLETAYTTLHAVQTAMLHNGGAAYLKFSPPARRLREAYFFANLTPTIKHLEKLMHVSEQVSERPSSVVSKVDYL